MDNGNAKEVCLDLCKEIGISCINNGCWTLAHDIAEIGLSIDNNGAFKIKRTNFVANPLKGFKKKELGYIRKYINKNKLWENP